MIQYQTALVDEDSEITGVWFLLKGSLSPEWIRLDIRSDNFSLVLRFHVTIENSNCQSPSSGKPLSVDSTCLNFFSRSLQHCLQDHNCECIDGWMPSRLLELCGNDIRLVEPSKSVKYATLSYVWGSSQQLKLTKSNYKDFTNGIEDLPRCFSDAVSIARQMGIYYI